MILNQDEKFLKKLSMKHSVMHLKPKQVDKKISDVSNEFYSR